MVGSLEPPEAALVPTNRRHSCAGHLDQVRKDRNLERARAEMGVEYIDLVMIHTPGGGGAEDQSTQPCLRHGWRACRREAWAAINHAIAAGRVRLGGVSNFGTALVDQLTPRPAVNQLELHPWSPNRALLAPMRERGVAVVGYAATKLLFERRPVT